jgi:thymidylate kinase
MLRGKFITFYGINNIGKSTHARILCDHLKKEGFDPLYIKYPIYDLEPSGPYLDKLIRKGEQQITEEELQLWFTINRHQYEEQLKSDLMAGKTIIAEDYIGTGIAWGITKGANEDWLEQINKYLLRSDLTILIDGERSVQAIEKGHIHETNNQLMRKSQAVHRELAKKYAWYLIKLQKKKKDTAKLVWEAVKEYFDY